MCRIFAICLLVLAGMLAPVSAQVVIRAPLVRVQVGNGVFVRAPFVRIYVPPRMPAYCPPPPAETLPAPRLLAPEPVPAPAPMPQKADRPTKDNP